jgi:type II secretory pathway pseudopilin PulG
VNGARVFQEATPRGSSARAKRAFTLLEILSLLMAIAVPGLGALSGVQLKESAGLLAGLIRDTYARTALLGRSTRLVLDLEAGAYWIEESPVAARLFNKKIEADRDGRAKLDPLDDRLEGIDADTTDEEERAKMQLLAPPSFKPVDGDDGKPHPLPSDVRFAQVWTEHLDDWVKGGQVALYFFPGGYTEETLITLTDDEEASRTLTVWVGALTGEVTIEEEIPRLPDLEED